MVVGRRPRLVEPCPPAPFRPRWISQFETWLARFSRISANSQESRCRRRIRPLLLGKVSKGAGRGGGAILEKQAWFSRIGSPLKPDSWESGGDSRRGSPPVRARFSRFRADSREVRCCGRIRPLARGSFGGGKSAGRGGRALILVVVVVVVVVLQ